MVAVGISADGMGEQELEEKGQEEKELEEKELDIRMRQGSKYTAVNCC